jgi:hypothetical protein
LPIAAIRPPMTPAGHEVSLLRGVTVTDETPDRHSFRFKWGSMELAVIGLPAVITIALGIVAFAVMRWFGLS